MFFDPIGVLQPLVINLKILFQKVCKEKFDWDEVISEELQEEWKMMMNSFKLTGKLKVSRKIVSFDDVDQLEKLELHGFSDASLQNYGAGIYLRSIFKSGTISVSLVTSKSRLAPIKGSTIPRLELLGNLLLSGLMDSVKRSLSKVLSISEVFLWTDSQVTLAWIRAENKEFQTFLENRVKEIRKLTDSRGWYYCNPESNPADLSTKTQNLINFQNCDLWWAVPNFLRKKGSTNMTFLVNLSKTLTKAFFYELKSTTCLQHNYKHVLDELAGTSIENVIDIKNNLVGKQICK